MRLFYEFMSFYVSRIMRSLYFERQKGWMQRFLAVLGLGLLAAGPPKGKE